MNKILKWLSFIVLGLTIALGIILIALYSYKKEILASINEKLEEMVDGDINIADVHITILRHFPNISIVLDDIHLRGPAYGKYHHPFLKAKRVDFNIEGFKLFGKQLSIKSVYIEHGEVFVFRTFDGYTNLDVFKKKTTPLAPGQEKLVVLDLKKINLIDVSMTYVDSLKKKSFVVHFRDTENSITARDSATLIHIGGKMKFVGLTLNEEKGSFLKDKSATADLNFELDASRKNVLLKPSILNFEKSSLKLSGLFMVEKPGSFQLDIESQRLDYKEGLTILPDTLAKKLSKYYVEKPVNININLKGILAPGIKPAIDITFSFENSLVTAGKINMDKMSMTGSFINHVEHTLPNDDSNSQLHFSSLKGLVDNLPVEAVVTLTDLRDPALKLKSVFNVDLIDLNVHLDTTKIKMISGHFISTFSYEGSLKEYLDDTRTRYDGHLSGKATVTNGKFNYYAKKIYVDKVNATFGFTEKKFNIEKLNLSANKNIINVFGTMTSYIPFFTTPETTGKVKLNITSPRLDISGILQPRKVVKSKSAKAASKKKVADVVEKLTDALEFDLDFKVDEFINKNFKAKQLKGNLILAGNEFNVQNSGMEFAGGKVELNMKVSKLQNSINPLQLQAKMKDVNLKEFFYAFNNFNQTTFSHEHIDGKLSLDVSLRAEINDKLDFLTKDLDGVATFKITDGSLRNFEPMQRLSNFLLKGRDFSDVQFGEITSNINMSGTKMNVSRMEVESTVLTMFIEGRYDLNDSSDLSIQVPLSNLKKRDQDFAPENIGIDSKVGASVYLRVRRDKTGKTTITYDPFKKFRKKKKNGNTATILPSLHPHI